MGGRGLLGQEAWATGTVEDGEFAIGAAFVDEHAVDADAEEFDATEFTALAEHAGHALGGADEGVGAGDTEQGHGEGSGSGAEEFALDDLVEACLDEGGKRNRGAPGHSGHSHHSGRHDGGLRWTGWDWAFGDGSGVGGAGR